MGTSESLETDRDDDINIFPQEIKATEKSKIDDRSYFQYSGHTGSVNSMLYFPCGRLVSSSFDKTIRVWDFATGECLGVLDYHKNFVRHIIKFNDDEFLSCSDDGMIFRISVLDGFDEFEIHQDYDAVLQLLKLEEDLIAFTTMQAYEINHSYKSCIKIKMEIGPIERKSVEKVIYQKIDRRTKLVKSQSHENSFYFNGMDNFFPIRLVDYKKNEITMVFIGHENALCNSLHITMNSKNEELLIVGGKHIYIYNTTSSNSKNTIYKTYHRKINPNFRGENDIVYSILTIGYHFLLVGNSVGEISVFGSKSEVTLVDKIRIHEETVFDMITIPDSTNINSDEKNKYLEQIFLTSSVDGKIKSHRLKSYVSSVENVSEEKVGDMVDMNKTNIEIEEIEEMNVFRLSLHEKKNFMMSYRLSANCKKFSDLFDTRNLRIPSILSWLYFPVRQVLIVGIDNNVHSRNIMFASLQSSGYKKPVDKNNEEEETEGEEEEESIVSSKIMKKRKKGTSQNSNMMNILLRHRFTLLTNKNLPSLVSILKWDDDTFLGITSNGLIKSYSIFDLNEVKTVVKVEFSDLSMIIDYRDRLLTKLDSDLFICTSDIDVERKELVIFSYSESSIYKKIHLDDVAVGSVICVSKKEEHSFYRKMIFEGDEVFHGNKRYAGSWVELVDYSRAMNNVVQSFKPYEKATGEMITSLDLFRTRGNDEILLCFTRLMIFFLASNFSTSSSSSSSSSKTSHEVPKMTCLRKILHQEIDSFSSVSFSTVLRNQVVLFGCYGNLKYVDLQKCLSSSTNHPAIYSSGTSFCSSGGEAFLPFQLPLKKKNDSICLLTCSSPSRDNIVNIILYKFLWDFRKELDETIINEISEISKVDLKERTEFVIQELSGKDCDIFHHLILISKSGKNISVYKSLLYNTKYN